MQFNILKIQNWPGWQKIGFDGHMRIHYLAAMTLALTASWSVHAAVDRSGGYLGIGLSLAAFETDSLYTTIELSSESVTGWRLEGGYIWDVGYPGGFRLGVAAGYDNWGEARGTQEDYFRREVLQFKAESLAINLVLSQAISKSVDFLFKLGPAYVNYDFEESKVIYSVSEERQERSESDTSIGASFSSGFAFYPARKVALDFAAQVVVIDIAIGGSLSMTVGYRF